MDSGMGSHDILESFPTAPAFHGSTRSWILQRPTNNRMLPQRLLAFYTGSSISMAARNRHSALQSPFPRTIIRSYLFHRPMPCQRRQTRFPGFGPFPRYALARCSGRISAKCRCYGEPASIPCPRHNFCCFHSKCRKTSPSCTPASAVEASRSSLFMNP